MIIYRNPKFDHKTTYQVTYDPTKLIIKKNNSTEVFNLSLDDLTSMNLCGGSALSIDYRDELIEITSIKDITLIDYDLAKVFRKEGLFPFVLIVPSDEVESFDDCILLCSGSFTFNTEITTDDGTTSRSWNKLLPSLDVVRSEKGLSINPIFYKNIGSGKITIVVTSRSETKEFTYKGSAIEVDISEEGPIYIGFKKLTHLNCEVF